MFTSHQTSRLTCFSSWRQLGIIILILFGLTPLLVETQLHDYMLNRGIHPLYAGTGIGLLLAALFLAVLYLITLRHLPSPLEQVGIRPMRRRDWPLLVKWTLLLIGVSIAIVLIQSMFGVGTDNTKTDSLQDDMSLIRFLVAFVSAAVISPIYEEIFYRGFLYRFFKERGGVRVGLLMSSTLFTLAHLPTTNTLLVNFASGLIFAWVYERTGSIFASMFIHGFVNGLAVILVAVA